MYYSTSGVASEILLTVRVCFLMDKQKQTDLAQFCGRSRLQSIDKDAHT